MRKRLTNLKMFNMIEVVLSIAVVGIGIAGIMAMFPVGIQASQDAVADNYAADAADQFLTFFEYNFKKTWPSSSSPTLPNKTESDSNGTPPTGPITGTAVLGNIYDLTSGTSKGVYGIKMASGTTTDFEAHAKVYYSLIDDFYYAGNKNPIPMTKAIRLNVEISWPTQVPYAQRQKRYYCLEIFNN
jgi:type II secretory pathway pseudopilin PulG